MQLSCEQVNEESGDLIPVLFGLVLAPAKMLTRATALRIKSTCKICTCGTVRMDEFRREPGIRSHSGLALNQLQEEPLPQEDAGQLQEEPLPQEEARQLQEEPLPQEEAQGHHQGLPCWHASHEDLPARGMPATNGASSFLHF